MVIHGHGRRHGGPRRPLLLVGGRRPAARTRLPEQLQLVQGLRTQQVRDRGRWHVVRALTRRRYRQASLRQGQQREVVHVAER